jgi:transcriptional regulator with XRE-family HTH domain
MQPLSRLKEYREKRMLTQMELSERSGVSRATIARLETTDTRATPKTARKLAEVLKVKPQTLL